MTNWVIDLDGVMWRGPVPIDGSAEAIQQLLARGDRVLFCTNNSTASGPERAVQLADRGVPVGSDVVTSADAMCRLVQPGSQVLVLGSQGLCDALRNSGSAVVSSADPGAPGGPPDRFDAVVVGLTRSFDYQQLDLARAAVAEGAELFATNTDPTYPGSDGIHVGTGSLVAALETATGRSAVVAGKPHAPMAGLIADHFSGDDSEIVVVGDQPSTDGLLAELLGARFMLVLSGVTTTPDPEGGVRTAAVAPDLASLVADRAAGTGSVG